VARNTPTAVSNILTRTQDFALDVLGASRRVFESFFTPAHYNPDLYTQVEYPLEEVSVGVTVGCDPGSEDRTVLHGVFRSDGLVLIEELPLPPNLADLENLRALQDHIDREIFRAFSGRARSSEDAETNNVTPPELPTRVGNPRSLDLDVPNFQWPEFRLNYIDFSDIRVRAEPLTKFSEESERRARTLLLANLTPEQRSSFEDRGYFDVIGGDTGQTYRLANRRVMNIHKLTENGALVKTWCVVPEGDLPTGDVLLSQKFALELYETDTLARAKVTFDIEGDLKG
jgi:hypothetical protein